jgi:3-keto-5-aminohexanoate cleavage enzyme
LGNQTKRLIDGGLISPRPYVQFVMGIQNALPADEHLLDILLRETKRVIPGATWIAAGIGRHQSQMMGWALGRGGDAVRTGMEDNIRINKDRLASGNAELVSIAAGLVEKAWLQASYTGRGPGLARHSSGLV